MQKRKRKIVIFTLEKRIILSFPNIFVGKMKKQFGGGKKRKETPIGNWDHDINMFCFFVFENNAKHMDYDILLGVLGIAKVVMW
jgi:hypothetical protein